MLYKVTFLLLVASAIGANIPALPIVNVHCINDNLCDCTVPELLDIHEPTVLNFVDAGEWRDSVGLCFPSTSNITVFPFGIFQQFPKLEYIKLRSGLKSIAKDDFKNANELTHLHILGTPLETLPTNVFVNAKKLVLMIIEHNQLTTIEDYAFNGLNELDSIFLNNNSLTTLKRNTFAGAPNIIRLELEHNRIESIEDGALDLPELRNIYLTNNRIQSLSDNVFRGAPELSTIAISKNGLKHIGKAFHECNELVSIFLDHNHIDDIDLVEFAKLPKLWSLGLNNSGFQWGSGEQWPDKASSLKWLYISNNNLSGSDALSRLRHFSNLVTLDLSGNNFSELNGFERIKQDFPQLIELGLSDNKYTCGKLQSIVNGLEAQNVTPFGFVAIDGDVKNYKGVTCV